jgi:hypothetical protein
MKLLLDKFWPKQSNFNLCSSREVNINWGCFALIRKLDQLSEQHLNRGGCRKKEILDEQTTNTFSTPSVYRRKWSNDSERPNNFCLHDDIVFLGRNNNCGVRSFRPIRKNSWQKRFTFYQIYGLHDHNDASDNYHIQCFLNRAGILLSIYRIKNTIIN